MEAANIKTLGKGKSKMEDNQTMAETITTTPVEPEATTTDTPVVNSNPVEPERTYTKSEVQALMKRRVDRSHNRVWQRYGVKSFEELDDILSDYHSIKDNYASLEAKNRELARDIALLKNNTLPERRDDIIAYFKGNDLEFNEDNLIQALTTHPEWVKQEPLRIESLGIDKSPKPTIDEKAIASKLFGTKL